MENEFITPATQAELLKAWTKIFDSINRTVAGGVTYLDMAEKTNEVFDAALSKINKVKLNEN